MNARSEFCQILMVRKIPCPLFICFDAVEDDLIGMEEENDLLVLGEEARRVFDIIFRTSVTGREWHGVGWATVMAAPYKTPEEVTGQLSGDDERKTVSRILWDLDKKGIHVSDEILAVLRGRTPAKDSKDGKSS